MKLVLKIFGFFLLWQTIHSILILFIVWVACFAFFGFSFIATGLTIVPFFSSFFTSLMFYSKTPSTSLRLKYKYNLIGLAVLPSVLLSIYFTQDYHLFFIFSISQVKVILLVSFLLLIYQIMGIFIAQNLSIFLKNSVSYKSLKYLVLILLSASFLSYITKPTFISLCYFSSTKPDNSVRQINQNELRQTTFTPVLNEKITSEKNLVWSATFQLCWDKFKDSPFLKPSDFPELDLIQKLNQEPFNTNAIDESTYVSLVSKKKIDFSKNIATKFKKDNSQLIKNLPPENIDRIFFYSYLESNLPFKTKFNRNPFPLVFSDGQNINSFGIKLYNMYNHLEKQIIDQVIVKYYTGNEKIIEIKSTAKDHHLILALVPPKKTLAETISSVDEFITLGEKETYIIEHNSNINIPIINFDVTQSYPQLENLEIGPGKIEKTEQRIKFKLNESGAFVLSEAYISYGMGMVLASNIIFDKPFLVMLRYKDEKQPYFAAWIGNSELLEKSSSTKKLR